MVENPAHLLKFLWGYFSANDGEFWYTSDHHLTVADEYRAGWKFARNIVEKNEISSYVSDLCRDGLLFSYVNNVGYFDLFPMNSPAGGVFDCQVHLKKHHISKDKGSVKPGRTRADRVVSDFTFRFKYNPIRDGFDETIYCKGTESSSELGTEFESLCKWANWDNGGHDVEKQIDLTWVRDRETAVEIAKKMIRWYTSRRWKVKITSDLALVHLELGDSVAFSPFEDWPDHWRDTMKNAVYRVTGKRISFKKQRVILDLTQVFE